MVLTYDELHKKTVAELREIAKGITHDAVQGASQMKKEQLLHGICEALGIEMHTHHHLAESFDKTSVKARMKMLKAERAKALDAHDTSRLHAIRRELHTLNHRIRANTV